MSRWQQVLLVLSLSVNLLIAGAFLGAFFHPHPPGRMAQGMELARPGAAMALMGPVRKFADSLPKQRQNELHDVIVEHQTGAAEFNKSMAAVRRDVAMALLAVPFDPAKFEAALKQMYQSEATARVANVTASAAFVEHLTDGERAAFLKTLNWAGVPGAEKAGADDQAPPKAP